MQLAKIVPLHSSLGNRSETPEKEKKEREKGEKKKERKRQRELEGEK